MSSPPPRAELRTRDLLGALVVLAVLALLFAGLSRGCSVSPGGPSSSEASPPPRVDLARELDVAARKVDHPVVVPQLPPGWRPTSTSTGPVGDSPVAAVRVGWLTPEGTYLRLSQSAVSEQDLVRAETGQLRTALGAVQVEGQTWVRYPSLRSEQAWVNDRGDVRLLVTGSATEADYRVLAAAARSGRPAG